MKSKIISNWNDIQPTETYTKALEDCPIYYDETQQTWVVFSYNYCKALLLTGSAHIPPAGASNPLLNDNAIFLIKKLVRLSNNEQHQLSRQAAQDLYHSIQAVSMGNLLSSLIGNMHKEKSLDWVQEVCKKLPVLYVMKGLGFNDRDCNYAVDQIGKLVKIMSPQQTDEEAIAINSITNELFNISAKHLSVQGHLKAFSKENHEIYVCNLIGLLIQSYDAARGLLCNALIYLIKSTSGINKGSQDALLLHDLVTETLRFDPPVHHTRRIAVMDIQLDEYTIKSGDKILIVLAAANLDPTRFEEPSNFNIYRTNNKDHLTFGAGGHRCLAKHLTVRMTVDVLEWLTYRFTNIFIPEQSIEFEPQLNVRLIKNLCINVFN